jgi:transcriptional regulator with XRE-family HTH domain
MTMSDKQVNYFRCMSKSELAEKCGVSISTIQKWLNKRYYLQLQKLGYQKNQRILLPGQVRYLIEVLVVIEDE